MRQDMAADLAVEVIVAPTLAVAMAAEAASTLQPRCHMLAAGRAITRKKRPTSMLAEGQVSSAYFRFQRQPDPTIDPALAVEEHMNEHLNQNISKTRSQHHVNI